MREIDKLSATTVSKKKKPGRYSDGGGLYLQISQWGTKAWLFRYMLDGRARQMGLGDVKTFSLTEARDRARAARQRLKDGIDPLDAKQEARHAKRIEAAKTITFKEAAERYIKAHRPAWKSPKHADQWRNTLTTYAFPTFGHLPVAAVDTGLVMRAIEPVWGSKTETASRTRGRIEAVLGWATVRGYRSGANPATWRGHLDKLLPAKTRVSKVRHQPAMAYADLPAFMVRLRAADSISATALEFLILTATRTSETINARWSEIDFKAKLWTIPAERTKSGRPQRVPLTNRTLAILKALPRERGSTFVFPGARKGKPLSNMALLELLRGMDGNGFTVHGMRSSFRDWAAEQTNYPRELAEAALGHVLKDKTEAAYQRGDLLEKRRRLMSAWEAYCARPTGSGKVVSLRKARAS
jgi:integrase